jgi:hypothetical protein
MLRKRPIDLNSHFNADVIRGNPAEFAVTTRPVFYEDEHGHREIAARRAIVREDTGEALAVVSDRYILVPHTRILEVIERAIEPLDLGRVPRGIYVDRKGAGMRALFKFPTLARPVLRGDEICPCVQVKNTYDGTSRISVHIGAFRFVCTNLAVGGGGAFAGGFLSVHSGEIPIEKMADQLADYLTRFEVIVGLYRRWSEQPLNSDALPPLLKEVLQGRFENLYHELLAARSSTVFGVYNRLTRYATHEMRSARTAFDMLERVNTAFQKLQPVIEGEVVRDSGRLLPAALEA